MVKEHVIYRTYDPSDRNGYCTHDHVDERDALLCAVNRNTNTIALYLKSDMKTLFMGHETQEDIRQYIINNRDKYLA